MGRVIIGAIKIHANKNEYGLTENDSFYIRRGSRHRMINLECPSIILEISLAILMKVK
jgi:mannose-6-phosphate isomerase-like protein (cupin superfamily)